jgi:hypothetical protein
MKSYEEQKPVKYSYQHKEKVYPSERVILIECKE